MAAVDLTGLALRFAGRDPLRFGGPATPSSGAAILMIERMGTRHRFRLETPMMAMEPHGRRWGMLLELAERQGGLISIPQIGFNVGAPGSPTVLSATASGKSIPVAGGTPSYAYRFGQWVSFVSGGRRYADRLTEQAIADASGAATLSILNLLRAPLAEGDTVEVGQPKAQGVLTELRGGDMTTDGLTSFSFTLTEEA